MRRPVVPKALGIAVRSTEGGPVSVGAAHILVAEDDPDIRANLVRLLRLEGFRVDAAADGHEALARLGAERPDLLLSDLMMPGLDGLALLAALRADPRTVDIPVVLLTARADGSDVQDGLAAGANAYIAKPYRREDLLQRIRALLPQGQD